MKYKVSVIVPIYNVEAYLSECVESLISQSHGSLEIILVDDGSTDRSGEMCDCFALQYSNVKVIHQENKGLPHARNTGLKLAEGEYVGFVDSDDVVHVDMYKKLVDAIEGSHADMAVCNCHVFNSQGVRAISTRYLLNVLTYETGNEMLFYDCAMDSSCNKVYKREIIEKYGVLFEDKSIVAQEDFWFLIRYCSHITKIVFLPDALYQYRERRSSITKSRSDRDITDRCITFLTLTEDYLNNVQRNSELFLESMAWNLLFASINQISSPCPKNIYNIAKKFSKTAYLKRGFQSVEHFPRSIRECYDLFKKILYKVKFYRTFAFFESLRVKRLQSKNNTKDQFD